MRGALPLVLFLSLASSGALAAEWIDLATTASPSLEDSLRTPAMKDCELREERSLRRPDGKRVVRYRQYYRSVPVYGETVVVDDGVPSGRLLSGIDHDLPAVTPRLDGDAALARARENDGGKPARNAKSELFVYLDGSRAHLVYQVSYLIISGADKPSRPFVLVDANSGTVLKRWEGLATAPDRGIIP
ncbi:PepSY domain-containing protein [Paludibacterium paludis]|uniref:Peptidase YpeB-like protein n=1 Tax=Paludibacterium paludis TaxID=1225769 RepID=A0A918P0N9_9NEIS|nr:PepSY domain-containing protein [Paludibacterium paludis]GGY12172.1 hypothetical protein GCM10011289_14070 [Paludibacterium paludis]